MKQVLNPFLPLNVCIADGEPHVFGDRVYVFGSHDTAGGESFCLEDYEFYSAPIDDLTNWSSKGTNYSAKQDPMYCEDRKYLYAPDVVRGNDGRYYLYYSLSGWKGKGGYSNPIAVAVCDTPDGKYEYYGVVQNPDGSPYLDWVCFDPALMNDNGVIRMYFGSGAYKAKNVTPLDAFILAKIYADVYGKPKESFLQKPGPLGANTAVLCDDMLTLKEPPKRIADTADFRGHAFYEGSSIRKVGDTYYFVYSSQLNHELCYATSKYPDRDFRFRGTLIDNGDVGINGRKERDRCNLTGTTHGGMECINGQWYIFYHRLTHGSDYSRQMCAENLFIEADGSIKQAGMSSCGLNKGVLSGRGEYPAACCCHLTNGRMPHSSNQMQHGIPMVSHEGDTVFVADATEKTIMRYRYFDLSETRQITIRARGSALLEISADGRKTAQLRIDSQLWQDYKAPLSGRARSQLELRVISGKADILSFNLTTSI